MAKKIVINENDNVKVIGNVSKLVTYKSDGETCTWIPEDETRLVTKAIIKDGIYIADDELGSPYGYSQVTVNGVGNKVLGQLGEKSITKNGTYIAENDSAGPFYGYSRVVVSIEGGSSGDGGGGSTPVVGKDDDGDDAEVKTDDDGTIVVEKLPTRISISVYPNNLVYEDGQLIDFTGLKVKAFLPNDTEWGVVDDDELIKPVKVAEGGEGGAIESRATSSLLDYEVPFGSVPVINGAITGYHRVLSGGTVGFATKYSYYTAAKDQFITKMWEEWGSDPTPRNTITSGSIGVTYYDKPVYFNGFSGVDINNISVPVIGDAGPNDAGAIAWTILYGDVTSGSQQTIPLQWKRPGDGKVLETSFTIAVHGS